MARKFKVFLFADSFQTMHQEQLRRAGHDPAGACVCMEVEHPCGEQEPPDSLLQAVRFAKEAKVHDTMCIDGRRCREIGRSVIVDSFNGTLDGRPREFRYLVGFTESEKGGRK